MDKGVPCNLKMKLFGSSRLEDISHPSTNNYKSAIYNHISF